MSKKIQFRIQMNLLNITIWSMKMQFNHYRHRLTGVNNKALIMKNKLNQG